MHPWICQRCFLVPAQHEFMQVAGKGGWLLPSCARSWCRLLQVTRHRGNWHASRCVCLRTRHHATRCATSHVEQLLRRDWMLERPDAQAGSCTKASLLMSEGSTPVQCTLACCLQIRKVCGDSGAGSFLVVQDDLLHPVLGGNKCRKLDALMPSMVQEGVTHVVRWVLLLPTGCLPRSALLAQDLITVNGAMCRC